VRERVLRESLKDGEYVVVSSYVVGQGEAYYEAAAAKGLEGVVAKRLESPYRPGERSREWLKVKSVKTADCVVVDTQGGQATGWIPSVLFCWDSMRRTS